MIETAVVFQRLPGKELGATVKVHVVMSPEDLQRATPALEQAVQKYG
jgi:hypothetical protein